MKKENSFLIVSVFWLLLFNILVLNFFLGTGFLATNALVTGAVVAPSSETSFVPGSVLKLAAPLLILNFVILIILIFVYERWVKENKETV